MDELEKRIAKALQFKADGTTTDPVAWAKHRQQMLRRGSGRVRFPVSRVVPWVGAAATVAAIAVTATLMHPSTQDAQSSGRHILAPIPDCPSCGSASFQTGTHAPRYQLRAAPPAGFANFP